MTGTDIRVGSYRQLLNQQTLTSYLQINLKNIFWINTSPLDDEFGNLKTEYTLDGLHLTEEGYRVLQDIVEKEII